VWFSLQLVSVWVRKGWHGCMRVFAVRCLYLLWDACVWVMCERVTWKGVQCILCFCEWRRQCMCFNGWVWYVNGVWVSDYEVLEWVVVIVKFNAVSGCMVQRVLVLCGLLWEKECVWLLHAWVGERYVFVRCMSVWSGRTWIKILGVNLFF